MIGTFETFFRNRRKCYFPYLHKKNIQYIFKIFKNVNIILQVRQVELCFISLRVMTVINHVPQMEIPLVFSTTVLITVFSRNERKLLAKF